MNAELIAFKVSIYGVAVVNDLSEKITGLIHGPNFNTRGKILVNN